MGLVVDTVSKVWNIPKRDIHKTPDFSPQAGPQFINGMAKAGEKLVMLLAWCRWSVQRSMRHNLLYRRRRICVRCVAYALWSHVWC